MPRPPLRSVAPVPLALLTLALTPACTDAGPARAASAPPAAQVDIQPVELLDAGSEPREVLTLRPTAGGPAARRTIVFDQSAELSKDDERRTAAQPRVTLPFAVSVTAADDRRIRVELDLDEAQWTVPDHADPDQVERLVRSTAGLDGVTLVVDLTARGEIERVTQLGVDGLAPAGRAQLGQLEAWLRGLLPQFPAEPVGPGASWQVRSTVQMAGLTMHQTLRYDLARREPERLVLGVTITHAAEGDAVHVPGIGPAALTSFSGSGEGEVVLHRDRAVPDTAEQRVRMNAAYAIERAADADPRLPRRAAIDTVIQLRLETPE